MKNALVFTFVLFTALSARADFTLELIAADSTVNDSIVTDVDVSKVTSLVSTINAAAPIGSMMMFPGPVAPAGWKFTDGSSLLKTQYPLLFTAIGTTYNTASQDSTHFNLPNTQGVFVRGAGTQVLSKNSLSYSGTLGAQQGDATKKNGLGLNDPGHSHGLSQLFSNTNNLIRQAFYDRGVSGLNTGYTTDVSGSNLSLNSGNSESRPANVGINYIIKIDP